MKTPIYTIKSFDKGINTYYFDLMSDFSFSISKDENEIINSKDVSVCIKKLKELGFEI